MIEPTIVEASNSPAHLNPTDKQIAEHATIQSFLNCYLRETGITSPNVQEIRCNLPHQGVQLIAKIRYWSPTGRHLFSFPLYYQTANGNQLELDYVTLVALLTKELALAQGSANHCDELLLRVIQSCWNIEQFVKHRRRDAELLYGFTSSFGETEQSLVFGHHLHPTPKSRQGFSHEELFTYSPELKGKFALHYFRVHHSIVQEGSALPQTATSLIKAQLQSDPEIDSEFKQTYCQEDDYSLLPVHPWQAKFLQHQPTVQTLFKQGLLQDLGQQGRAFLPTSSIRTVYHPESAFMLKLSLNVKITNSVRTNLYKELERSVEVYRLLEGKIGQDLREKFPQFSIIRDPAYITIKMNGEPQDSFSTILRENPFIQHPETDATCLIALCQDSIFGDGSRLAHIIHQLAKQEQQSTAKVSVDWFQRYLKISLEPILWLYFTYGIAIEAHQQNSVLQLQDGYPFRFFYRDNQGYYYGQSFSQQLEGILPGISQKSQTFCDNAVIDERLGYYLFLNNLFGLINAFGVAGLVDEKVLLAELRMTLEKQAILQMGGSVLLPTLLSQTQLRCKANLLTRFHDMDELVGSVATQSVYVSIDNPLGKREEGIGNSNSK